MKICINYEYLKYLYTEYLLPGETWKTWNFFLGNLIIIILENQRFSCNFTGVIMKIFGILLNLNSLSFFEDISLIIFS